MTDPIIEEENEQIVEKDSIEKHTTKQKESIFKAIGTTIWLGVEELSNAIGGESKKAAPKDTTHHQITPELEKEEAKLIKKRGIHEE